MPPDPARSNAPPPPSPERSETVATALLHAVTLLICGTLGVGSAQGQVRPPPPPGTDSVTVVPADYCEAGRVYSALAGSGYRQLWTTAMKVPVADLGKLGGGGLTPIRLGGGMTTQTLHAQGVDGRRYVFRSVQKTTRQALAEEYWGTPVEAIMRDQLCSFHPTGAVIVSRLLDAVGVLHTHPRYMVLPDDPRLGEFRHQFAGMLVLFEERPDESVNGGPGFAGSDRIVQIENLFDALQEGPLERLDAPELLRSMLIDILVGDRDRSVNNYLWARFPDEKGGHVWRPVPRDRDQAFVRFDGALKALARTYENRLVSFGDHYPNLEGLTRNAWDIDRNLLVGIDRDSWNAIVRQVQGALTDEVISEAVQRLPPEHYALVGAQTEASLRRRRDDLGEASAALYRIVFQDADIQATDADEVALVRGVGEGRIRVAIFRRGTASDTVGRPYFDRTFSPGVTREIRLYLHGGDDLIRVEGSAGSPIVVRAIGGGGRDELVHRSGPRKVIFYDGGDRTRVEGDHTELVHRAARPAYSWWVDGPSTPDWGAERFPVPVFGYDRDRGLVLGLGVRRDAYAFLKKPFSSRTVLTAGWAVGPSEPILEYRQYVQNALGPWALQLRARYSGIEVLRYYGPGNEAPATQDPAFYRVHQKQLILSAEAALGNGDLRWVSVGPVFRHTSSDTSNAATFIAQSRPYGTGSFSQLGLRVSWNLDGRNIQAAPRSGYHVEGEAAYYPQALGVRASFGTMQGDAAVYASPPGGNPTLALRVGGKKVWGDYPYSDAAFLGGKNDVRGLREQRYTGDAAVFGNAELRVFVTRFFLLFPMDFGVFGLTDAGRVFVQGESSNAWHGSWGGGVWLAPVSRAATVHLSLARHDHRTLLYVGSGFAF